METKKGKSLNEYRNKIFDSIISSQNLVELLDENFSGVSKDNIFYNKVYPYEFIPEPINDLDKFINFDLKCELNPDNSTYKDITLYFYIFCHKDIVKTAQGTWYDLAANELECIFAEQNNLGIGKTIFDADTPYSPNEHYVGRILSFKAKDFRL